MVLKKLAHRLDHFVYPVEWNYHVGTHNPMNTENHTILRAALKLFVRLYFVVWLIYSFSVPVCVWSPKKTAIEQCGKYFLYFDCDQQLVSR